MNTFKQFVMEDITYRELNRRMNGNPKTPKKLYTIFNNKKVWSDKIYAHSPAQAVRFFKRRYSEYAHTDLDAKEYVKEPTQPIVAPVAVNQKPPIQMQMNFLNRESAT